MLKQRSSNPNKLVVLFLCISLDVFAAAGGLMSAISARVTSNRQPIIWKNIDSHFDNISLCFFDDADYDFIGVILQNDSSRVLGGLNSAGFALLYTGASHADEAGIFVKNALGTCGRLRDFQQILAAADTMTFAPTTSFACLDNFGECALFELPDLKYDVNTASVCPDGFCVRSDFVFSTLTSGSHDFWRYHRVMEAQQVLAHVNKLETSSLLAFVLRDLQTPAFNPYPLPCKKNYADVPRAFVPTKFAVNQSNTVGAIIIEGAPDYPNSTATMWTLLGNPLCSAALPVWPQTGFVPKAAASPNAFLSSVNNMKKQRLYSFKKDTTLVDTKLYMGAKTGFYHQITAFEQSLFTQLQQNSADWRRLEEAAAFKEMGRFQQKAVSNCTKVLR